MAGNTPIRPMFSNLPPELLIEIFKNLSYIDLRIHIASVSHRFRDIITSEPPVPALREPLRKGKPIIGDIPHDEQVTAHPAFARMHFHPTSYYLDEITFNANCSTCRRKSQPQSYLKPLRLVDTPILKEAATEPAVNNLTIQIAHLPSLQVRSKDSSKAVTVEDVMSQVTEYLSRRCPQDLLPPVLSGRYRNRGSVTRGDMLYSEYRRVWHGVQRVEVMGGEVYMKVLGL